MSKSLLNKAWEFRLAALMFGLFSINSLGSCVLAASAGCVWDNLDWQSRLTVILAVIVNWTNAVMAYVSKAAKKIESGQPPIGDDTSFVTKPNPPADPAAKP